MRWVCMSTTTHITADILSGMGMITMRPAAWKDVHLRANTSMMGLSACPAIKRIQAAPRAAIPQGAGAGIVTDGAGVMNCAKDQKG